MSKGIVKAVLVFLLLNMLAVAFYVSAKGMNAYAQMETSDGWTMFQFNAACSGYTENEGPHTPNVLWKYKVSMNPRYSIVANGKVFFGSGMVLYCVDAYGGGLLWKREVYDWVYSIAEDEGKLFVGAINSTYLLLCCFDEVNGELLWFRNPSEMDGDKIYEATPTGITLTDGKIYLNAHVKNESRGYLLCLNESDGVLLWNFPLTDESPHSSPAVEEDRVFIIGQGEEWINETFSVGHSHLYCVNATTGGLVWKITLNLAPPMYENPLSIAHGKVIAPFSDTKIVCVNVANGEMIWEYDIPNYNSPVSCFAVAHDNVFVGSYRRLDVVNEINGEFVWGINGTEAGFEFGWAVSLIAKDRLYLSTDYPQGVWCFNATTGERLWNYLTATKIIGTAGSGSIVEGELFIPLFDDDDSSYLFCFKDQGEGVAVWPFVINGRCDVGTAQTIYFRAIWTCNGSAVRDGIIFINGAEYVTNSSGWISFNFTSSSVTAVSWVVTAVNCSGVTRYFQMGPVARVIWDRIIIFDGGVDSPVVDVGKWVTVWFKAAYEYNNESFYGLLFVNGSAALYFDTSNRWEYEYKTETLGTVMFEVTGVSDRKYGLKTVNHVVPAQTVTVKTPFPWRFVAVAVIVAGITLVIVSFFLKRKKGFRR
ncbi:MAG: PQQ-binding-like beta-propeller repeat protein [Candidatus Bathyarchaeota archaeon]|nr:PQQ-binding-like beta-propeller repeat protein [Candidatus Bathyarchaeota archaeon]